MLLILNAIALLIMQIFFCGGLAGVFGKSKGFAVGLFFLFPIFLMILAFGKAQHYRSDKYDNNKTIKVWTCAFCGTENQGSMFCANCGKSRNAG